MSDISYQFDMPPSQQSIIKVVGVGGGGSNAVNHMFNKGIKDVNFVVVNTDMQALKNSPVPKNIQIGINLTAGLGAGANPEKGREAALENKEEIRDLLSDGTKMLFITAGMGGGTGTGAAPVIAEVARDLEILTVGIVTMPFSFEGRKKIRQAQAGIEELRKHCDTVIVILNDKLKEILGNLPIRQAFSKADEVLSDAAKSIAEIISEHAEMNVDFEDVVTVMKNSGASVMGSAVTQGDQRAVRAAEEAISSPLLNNKDIYGAQRILLSIMSGPDAELDMDELGAITNYIQDKAGGGEEEAEEVIWGWGIDETLGESIRVTVIATGFPAVQDVLENGTSKKKSSNVEKKLENVPNEVRSDFTATREDEPIKTPVEPIKESSTNIVEDSGVEPIREREVLSQPLQEQSVVTNPSGSNIASSEESIAEETRSEPRVEEESRQPMEERNNIPDYQNQPSYTFEKPVSTLNEEKSGQDYISQDEFSQAGDVPSSSFDSETQGQSSTTTFQEPKEVIIERQEVRREFEPQQQPPIEQPTNYSQPSNERTVDRGEADSYNHSQDYNRQQPSNIEDDRRYYNSQRGGDLNFETKNSQEDFVGLDENYQIIDKQKSINEETLGPTAIEKKREILREKGMERVQQIRNLDKPFSYDEESIRDRLNVPAYIRKQRKLEDIPRSADNNVSRYNLNDDQSRTLGDNKFLHDNVD
ncbi:cell division protein FtsZ [Aureibacter tunicatorum]|uniref:Cell division protein FtsZ n=1 Tax=Aureibacter tunicatorum TaxID=866807 RepID=A0AAE3XSK0_9BACT|nr:cell division protein FtsZ [Aureibacter tunicatorum]BDD03504.1 hypothetical protein AUTU_09870 [Aureibacter tunicatorum]